MVNKSDAKETRRGRKPSTSAETPVKIPKEDVYAVSLLFSFEVLNVDKITI